MRLEHRHRGRIGPRFMIMLIHMSTCWRHRRGLSSENIKEWDNLSGPFSTEKTMSNSNPVVSPRVVKKLTFQFNWLRWSGKIKAQRVNHCSPACKKTEAFVKRPSKSVEVQAGAINKETYSNLVKIIEAKRTKNVQKTNMAQSLMGVGF